MGKTARKADRPGFVCQHQLTDGGLDHVPAETGIRRCCGAKLAIVRQPAVLRVFLVAVRDYRLVGEQFLRPTRRGRHDHEKVGCPYFGPRGVVVHVTLHTLRRVVFLDEVEPVGSHVDLNR